MGAVEYERLLQSFDGDDDGKISPSELSHRLGRLLGGDLSLEEVEAAVACIDSDGDGLLDVEDLVAVMEGGGEEEKLKAMMEAFGIYDVDGCGYITPVSLRRTLSQLGQSRSVDECRVMIQRFDLNGDGVICFNEFAVMIQS